MYNVRDLLNKQEIPYEIIQNEKPIYSAQDGADYFKIQIGQTAPTLIVKAGDDFYAVVISGCRKRVGFEKIKELVKCDSVRMATKGEVEEATGFSAGSIPLLGLPLPYIIDEQLCQYDFIYGGTGTSNLTLKVRPDALVKVNKVVGSIRF